MRAGTRDLIALMLCPKCGRRAEPRIQYRAPFECDPYKHDASTGGDYFSVGDEHFDVWCERCDYQTAAKI